MSDGSPHVGQISAMILNIIEPVDLYKFSTLIYEYLRAVKELKILV